MRFTVRAARDWQREEEVEINTLGGLLTFAESEKLKVESEGGWFGGIIVQPTTDIHTYWGLFIYDGYIE